MTDRLTEIMRILERQQTELDVTPAGTFARILGIDTTARAIMALDGWRDIATAPKMKGVLLFAVTDTGEDGSIKNWKMGSGFWHSGYEAWEWEGRILKAYDHQPTHWHPLPPAPEPQP
jgi:hypothetical protein